MNIFVLDHNPYIAAQYHNNKHCVKMILETAQLLSTAHHVLDGEQSSIKNVIYKKTHVNHPCAKWVRECSYNYEWTFQLFLGLLKEYTHRYGKIHATQRMIKSLCYKPDNITYSDSMTPFAQCMPDAYKCDNAVEAYRTYYINDKHKMAQWKNRERPYWYDRQIEAIAV